MNHSLANFSSRDSALTGTSPAASADVSPPVRVLGQQRDTAHVVGGLIDVLLRSLAVPIAFVAPLPDALKWADAWPETDADAETGAVDRDAFNALLFGRDTALADTLARAMRDARAPLLIEDTRTHALVRGVEPVRGVRILSCIAVPVFDQDGQTVAALCALDGVPRWWMEKDVSTLTLLAEAVGALLTAPVNGAGKTIAARPHQPQLPVDGDSELHTELQTEVHTELHTDLHTNGQSSVADALLESMPDGALLINRDWTVRWFNSALAAMLDIPPPSHAMEQLNAHALLNTYANPVVLAGWQRALDTDTADMVVWHNHQADKWIEAHAWPATNGLAILLRDITESRRSAMASERRAGVLHNARSFRVIEQLAGGVAHDFNNLLTIIRANAELMQLSPASHDIAVEVQEIQRAATRATDLTQQLLAFAQQQRIEPTRVSLNHALAALVFTLRSLLPANIRVETSLSYENTTVQVDLNQFREIIQQVVCNARDAMPDGGALTLVTAVHVLDAPLARKPLPVPAGAWVSLTVRDTGSGIAPEHLDRVFEPFFTTRDVGSGVGLGLSTVFGVVAQSGGVCTLESELGGGTSVSIWLPAIDGLPAHRALRTVSE